jgi:hypothetical protein
MEIGDDHQQGPKGDGRQYDPPGENLAFPHLIEPPYPVERFIPGGWLLRRHIDGRLWLQAV